MPRGKAEQAEAIGPKLREVEVELGRGKTVAEAYAAFRLARFRPAFSVDAAR